MAVAENGKRAIGNQYLLSQASSCVMAISQGRVTKWYNLDLLCLVDASGAKGMSTAHTYIAVGGR